MTQSLRREFIVLGVLLVIALALRIECLTGTYEVGGDGQCRACMSYVWALKPHWIASGYWLPGYLYLGGIVMWLIPEPIYALRVMNTVVSGALVALVYIVGRRFYGMFAGFVAALTLALLPLSIGLSASSLTETSSAFELVASYLLLTLAAGNLAQGRSRRGLALLGLATLAMIALETTRSESWILIPLWCAYIYLRTRKWRLGVGLLLVLAVFPAYWLYGCASEFGQPFVSFAGWKDPNNTQIPLADALEKLARITFVHAGVLVPLAGLTGLAWRIYVCWKKRAADALKRLDELFYLTLALTMLFLEVLIAMRWGDNFQHRYLNSALILILPLAGAAIAQMPLARAWRERPGIAASACALYTAFVVLSLTSTYAWTFPFPYVQRARPTELVETASWLARTNNDRESVVLTSLAFRSFYIPLSSKRLFGHYFIVSDFWTPPDYLRQELSRQPPRLLITADGDGKDLAYLKRFAQFEIEEKPLFVSGDVRVLRIQPGSFKIKQDPAATPTLWQRG